jgi:hypothetical protein
MINRCLTVKKIGLSTCIADVIFGSRGFKPPSGRMRIYSVAATKYLKKVLIARELSQTHTHAHKHPWGTNANKTNGDVMTGLRRPLVAAVLFTIEH